MMKNNKNIALLLTSLFCLSFLFPWMGTVKADVKPVTVILSSQGDPYYSLAEEIASVEGIPVYATFEEAAANDPVFLLWVVAPQHLSEEVLLGFSSKMKEHSGSISMGIISGQTIDDARRLWIRGSNHLLPANDYTIINGNGATQKIEPEIVFGDRPEKGDVIELNQPNLLAVLATQSNVQITVEGTATSWFDQHAGITIHEEDIPPLDETIIMHYGCSTFQPWAAHSIANACIHQGAAAYLGFIKPSIVGTRFGDYNTNGLLYTWEKFPLGHLVQIQNQASMQSYANIGHFFLLGDPRIYRQSEMPYTVIRDEMQGDTRILEISDLPAGLIPIYVADGAAYDYVSITGLSSTSMDELFFNRNIQMMNINHDKFIMIENQQDSITIELKHHTPLFWKISSSGIKFMDMVIVDGHNATLYVVIMVLFFLLTTIRAIRKRLNKAHLFMGMGLGAVMALLTGVLTLLRMNRIEGSNVPLNFNTLFLMGIFTCTSYGLMLYLGAENRKGKVLALFAANLNSLVTVLIFMVALIVRQVMIGEAISMEKFTYPWLFPLQKLVLGMIFYTMVFALYKRMVNKKSI